MHTYKLLICFWILAKQFQYGPQRPFTSLVYSYLRWKKKKFIFLSSSHSVHSRMMGAWGGGRVVPYHSLTFSISTSWTCSKETMGNGLSYTNLFIFNVHIIICICIAKHWRNMYSYMCTCLAYIYMDTYDINPKHICIYMHIFYMYVYIEPAIQYVEL